MEVQLHIQGKCVKLWPLAYEFGPSPWPSGDIWMQKKELDLKDKVLECKVDGITLIYNSDFEMYAVVRSKLRPADIPENEWQEFLLTVAKNKQKV